MGYHLLALEVMGRCGNLEVIMDPTKGVFANSNHVHVLLTASACLLNATVRLTFLWAICCFESVGNFSASSFSLLLYCSPVIADCFGLHSGCIIHSPGMFCTVKSLLATTRKSWTQVILLKAFLLGVCQTSFCIEYQISGFRVHKHKLKCLLNIAFNFK